MYACVYLGNADRTYSLSIYNVIMTAFEMISCNIENFTYLLLFICVNMFANEHMHILLYIIYLVHVCICYYKHRKMRVSLVTIR